jgi:ribonuclease HI
MNSARPHYLLHAETYRSNHGGARWKFVLQSVGDGERFTASDCEPTGRRSRLELLAVVRGLEALDQPARVTLLTRSKYVSNGIRRQLAQWREHHWQWERFGSVAPIRDYDLWRRIDRALEFHTVECCVWHADTMPAQKLQHAHRPASQSLPAALAKLGRGVLAPLTHLWPPTFTRAA